ncbi:hypothetical protein BKA70DRAFT_1218763 [Coprinopsis sp. MPI-PUGE-AT-0042]|nr:hypothetical protein BKA70DRAFT_1218763 [Coprinopsis sp. MPI-PUGE-AT-0042]
MSNNTFGIHPSTASVDTTSSATTTTSHTPLRAERQPKDFSAAFGALQSRYGTGAGLPSPKTKPSNKLPKEGSSTDSSSSLTLSGSPESSSSKDKDDKRQASKGPSLLKALFKGKCLIL